MIIWLALFSMISHHQVNVLGCSRSLAYSVIFFQHCKFLCKTGPKFCYTSPDVLCSRQERQIYCRIKLSLGIKSSYHRWGNAASILFFNFSIEHCCILLLCVQVIGVNNQCFGVLCEEEFPYWREYNSQINQFAYVVIMFIMKLLKL